MGRDSFDSRPLGLQPECLQRHLFLSHARTARAAVLRRQRRSSIIANVLRQRARKCQGAAPHGKPPVEVVDFGMLAWNEIPARRANDPGARIAELSTNASRTRITSLMDCRPGWKLDDHDHPSDVLTFCIRGGGILGIEDETTVYEAGIW